MNVTRFLEHWQITDNPFKAEEARHDAVFARLGFDQTAHPDFEKVMGDFDQPSAAIVFGEKGSGKTAIRLQMAERIAQHNRAHHERRILLAPYDDLNPMLDRMVSLGGKDAEDSGDILKRLRAITLADHLDAILHTASPRAIDLLLGVGDEQTSGGAREVRSSPLETRRGLQMLQALYDRAEGYESRAALLRKRLGLPWNSRRFLWRALAILGWIPAALIVIASFRVDRSVVGAVVWLYAFYAAVAFWALLLLKWMLVDQWLGVQRSARRAMKALRAVPREFESLSRTLGAIPAEHRAAHLPTDHSDDRRYAMIGLLRRALEPVGYRGIIIVVDRVDEPTAISGQPDRMRAVVWPLLNNKFLQQEGVGVKLLLPAELRHELFRESSAFFQEARLDKQNLIERLTWSGAALYDLCNARLRACRPQNAEPLTIRDLFDEETSRQDIVDALNQMNQPRDAFKLLYQCMQEHCSNVTEEQQRWRIPRLVLETARKQQAERVLMLQRGYRPA